MIYFYIKIIKYYKILISKNYNKRFISNYINKKMLLVELNEKIRAIKIPENYDCLIKKVEKEYSLSKEQISKIFFTYIDEEDNSIYVTNNDDFLYAIPFSETIVLKIEFKETETEKKQPSIDSLLEKGDIDTIIEKANKRIIELKKETKIEDENLEHQKLKSKNKPKEIQAKTNEEINCNECGNNIKGIRYMCGICHNYNLCEECENKYGLEHNHPLLKIRKPELCPVLFSYSLKK